MTDDPQTPWFPIRTQRLLLREARLTDYDDIHAYAIDPEVVRFMPWGPNTPEVTAQALGGWVAMSAQWPRGEVNLVMELAQTGRAIGAIRLSIQSKADRTADFGYTLNRDYWRQGFGTEAASAIVETAFTTLGLHRVFATCDTLNVGSYGIMEKLGMRREGTLRQDQNVRGRWRDTHVYALLAEEWAARRAEGA
jgi:RimJ/RimL family protein N-acetyltransferase